MPIYPYIPVSVHPYAHVPIPIPIYSIPMYPCTHMPIYPCTIYLYTHVPMYPFTHIPLRSILIYPYPYIPIYPYLVYSNQIHECYRPSTNRKRVQTVQRLCITMLPAHGPNSLPTFCMIATRYTNVIDLLLKGRRRKQYSAFVSPCCLRTVRTASLLFICTSGTPSNPGDSVADAIIKSLSFDNVPL